MIASCALSSGSPLSSRDEVPDRSDVGTARHARGGQTARPFTQLARKRGDERVVAVVGEARAIAPVRRERHALARLAVGAQRLPQLVGVGLLGPAVARARRKVHVQVSGDARLDQEHVLAERAEVGVDRVEREHRPHPRLEGRVAQPGLGRPGIGEAELHRRDPHAVVVGVDQARQHEHAVAADLLRRLGGRGGAQRGRRPRRSAPPRDQHGAVHERRGLGRGQQDVAGDEQLGHGGHAIGRR